MRGKKLVVLMVLLLVMMAAPKLIRAAPDTYYLEDGYALTTSSPSDPYSSITISGKSTFTGIWLSGPINGNISAGNYNFTFWMAGDVEGVHVDITFKFGYQKNNIYYDIVTVSISNLNLDTSPTQYSRSVSRGGVDIPEGSQLYLNVSIYNRHGNKNAYFYYSGATYNTNVTTPSITVPEFSSGILLVIPALLVLYFVLRHRLFK